MCSSHTVVFLLLKYSLKMHYCGNIYWGSKFDYQHEYQVCKSTKISSFRPSIMNTTLKIKKVNCIWLNIEQAQIYWILNKPNCPLKHEKKTWINMTNSCQELIISASPSRLAINSTFRRAKSVSYSFYDCCYLESIVRKFVEFRVGRRND